MQSNQKNNESYIYCHPNMSVVSNWIASPQNLFLSDNSNLIFYPSAIFPDTNFTDSPLFISFPLINEPTGWNAYLETKTEEKSAELPQSQPLYPLQNNQFKDIPIKPQRRRRKKKNELQNIKNLEKDRNILSNSLKFFFKNLRASLKLKDNYPQKIIKKFSIDITLQKFEQRLNQIFPLEQNYIRPNQVKYVIDQEQRKFALILKLCLRKFFKEEIYLIGCKYTQIQRSFKKHQIVAGRRLLEYFYGQNEQANQGNI